MTNQNKSKSRRLYFIDPIKAAWMAREFDVQFNVRFSGCSEDETIASYDFSRYPGCINRVTGKFYVTKESESIFVAKNGDISSGNVFDSTKNRWCGWRQHKREDYNTEFRDKKHFFSCEV